MKKKRKIRRKDRVNSLDELAKNEEVENREYFLGKEIIKVSLPLGKASEVTVGDNILYAFELYFLTKDVMTFAVETPQQRDAYIGLFGRAIRQAGRRLSKHSSEKTILRKEDKKEKIHVIFKVGDDMRQDQLVMQCFKTLEHVWRDAGLLIPMTTYQCTCMWSRGGLLEVVKDAKTLGDLQLTAGLTGAFSEIPVRDYLKKHNEKETFDQAIDTFMRSTAGYCVATCILGCGDRHSDNIMVTKNGNLFHIDFGHFLGTTMAIKGYRRERCRFVLDPGMVSAIISGSSGLDKLKEFKNLALQAYIVARRNHRILIHLFSLAIPMHLPELSEMRDLEFMREMLQLELTEDEAKAWFQQLIDQAMADISRIIDNTAHNLKQKMQSSGKSRDTKKLQNELKKAIEREERRHSNSFNDLKYYEKNVEEGGTLGAESLILSFGTEVGQLLPEDCRVMGSAAAPLWLTFEK
eukprot:g1211.t1